MAPLVSWVYFLFFFSEIASLAIYPIYDTFAVPVIIPKIRKSDNRVHNLTLPHLSSNKHFFISEPPDIPNRSSDHSIQDNFLFRSNRQLIHQHKQIRNGFKRNLWNLQPFKNLKPTPSNNLTFNKQMISLLNLHITNSLSWVY